MSKLPILMFVTILLFNSSSKPFLNCPKKSFKERNISFRTNDATSIDNEGFYKTYVYFGNVFPAANITTIKGHFFSSDGFQYECEGEKLLSIGLANNSTLNDRLYSFRTPERCEMSYFEILHNETKAQWSITPLSKISGITFKYDTLNYSNIMETTGWDPIHLNMVEFADYFLSRINPSFFSQYDGYMSYPYVEKFLLKYVDDFDLEDSKTIKWNDVFKQEEVSLFDRMNELSTLVEANDKDNGSVSFVPYIIGVCILIIVTFLVLRDIGVKLKNVKRK